MLSLPSLVNPWVGIAFLVALIVVGIVLFRNRWRKLSIGLLLIAVLQPFAIHSHWAIPAWRVWAKSLTETLPKGITEDEAAVALQRKSNVVGRGQYGVDGNRYIDIQPKGFAALMQGDYWRIVLIIDSDGKITRTESHRLEP